jgi:hypothetical protein
MTETSEEFYRIQKLPPYVFAVINEMRAKARAAQIDVIDMGMGNPDGATPTPGGRPEQQLALLGVRMEMAAVYLRLVRG